MPTRLIKESICSSDTINELTWFQEVLFIRLLTVCDDYGRFDARPLIIKGKLFPLKEDLRANQLTQALNALENAGLIFRYQAQGRPYLQVATWDKHQQIRAKKSKFPAPDGNLQASDNICNQMISDDNKCPRNPNPIRIQSESKSESEEKARATRFAPPTAEEVAAYCAERKSRVDPQTFVDFYAAKGWKVGNTPMKDWRAAVRTWEQRDRAPARPQKTVAAQNYEQREYDETQLENMLGVNDLFAAGGE